ncbi:MAG: TonB-dependent receptor [Urechidicola sp.]|nr:TonB-dependent receptor [Urechidicola sp.]
MLIIQQYAWSQESISITGVVNDIDNTPIQGVSVIAYDNATILGYTYSNDSGEFHLILNIDSVPEKIILKAQHIGFETSKKELTISNLEKIIFNLKEKSELLNEVVLESWEKIKVNKDTVTYKAAAFSKGNEQVVEDLLKNIPSIDIDTDGTIKINGKPIDKLLIEGDDLLNRRYSLLSKNLDASVIEEVQVLNNFEDNPILKDFQESEKVALNLILKEDKRNVWFGNINVGIGTDKHYNIHSNLGLLRKDIKLFNLINLNNTGTKATTQSKNLKTYQATKNKTDKKIEKESKQVITIDNDNSFLPDNLINFNKSYLGSLNLLKKINQTSLRGTFNYSLDKLEKKDSYFVDYFVEDNLNYSEVNTINKEDISLNTEFELKSLINKKTYLTYLFNYENTPSKTTGNLIYNSLQRFQHQKDKTYNLYNHVNITKTISDKSLFLLYAYLGKNNNKQKYSLDFVNSTNDNLHQNTENPLTYYGITSEIASRSNKNEWGVSTTFSYDSDQLNSIFNFNVESPIDSLSNNTIFENRKIDISGKFTHNFSEKLSLRLSASLTDNFTQLNNKKENLFFFNPKIGFSFKKTKLGNFGINYNYLNRLPTILYLNKNYLLRSYRSFSKGIENVQQIGNHSFSLFHTYNNYKKQFQIHALFLYSISDNKYGNKTFLDQNYTYTELTSINVESKLTTFNFQISKYLIPLQTSIKLSTNQTWNKSPSIINNEYNILNNYNASYRLQGTTYFNLPIDFKFYIQYNYSKGKFNTQTTSNEYLDSSIRMITTFSPEIVLEIGTQYNKTYDDRYFFSNFNINYKPQNSKWSFLLIGNNLTNIDIYSNTIISEFQKTESSFQLVPRYFLLNAKYRF